MPCRSPVGLKDYPFLLKEWHETKNGQLTPDDVSPSSKKKVWWKCERRHEWEAAVYSRTYGGTCCPYCAGKGVGYGNSPENLYPAIAAQWHPERNGILTPFDVRPGSHKKAWWVCPQNHEWQALGWTPSDVTHASNKKIWWLCPTTPEHVWKAAVCDRTSGGHGCPFCSGHRVSKESSLAAVRPDLAAEWNFPRNKGHTPDDVAPGSHKKAWWLCNAGHAWQALINNRNKGSGCPHCGMQRRKKQ